MHIIIILFFPPLPPCSCFFISSLVSLGSTSLLAENKGGRASRCGVQHPLVVLIIIFLFIHKRIVRTFFGYFSGLEWTDESWGSSLPFSNLVKHQQSVYNSLLISYIRHFPPTTKIVQTFPKRNHWWTEKLTWNCSSFPLDCAKFYSLESQAGYPCNTLYLN